MYTKIASLACTLFLIAGISFSSQAQSSHFLTGTVRDSTGQPVPYCSVSAQRAADSLNLGGTVSDTAGCYRLGFPEAGRYRVQYTHLAFRPHSEEVEIPARKTLDVRLRPATENIDEVVVVARHTKLSAGKMEVSMVGNPLAKDRTVSEVLDLLPGIRLQKEQIYINGKPASLIYIGDRQATLSELAALTADQVDKIEVQHQAGSAYDATLTGGIVRIRLRRLASGSFYGNLDAGTAQSPYLSNYSLNFPFSLQYGKLNFYNQFRAYYNDDTAHHLNTAQYLREGYGYEARTRGKSQYGGLNETLSLVYEFNPRHTLGVYGNFAWTQSDPLYAQTTAIDTLPDAENPRLPDARYTAYNHGGSIFNRIYQAVASYTIAFDSLGSRFNWKTDYVHKEVGKQYDYTTLEYASADAADPLRTERLHESFSPVTDQVHSRADLTKNFSARRTLSAGLSYHYGQANNNSVMRQLAGDQWIFLDNQSLLFINRLQNGSAYATFADAYGGFSYQAGLRFQWDRISYRENGLPEWTHRDYGRLFPEVSLSYLFNEEKSTRLNLDVSTGGGPVPSGSLILPKRIKTSDYSYTIGNPQLKPNRGFYVDLTYLLRGKWTFCYYFGNSYDLIYDFNFYDAEDPRITYQMPINLGKSFTHYLEAGVDASVTKWLRVSASVFGQFNRKFYMLDGERYRFTTRKGELYCKLIFQLHPTLRLNTSFSARTKQYWAPEKWLNADYHFSAGILKTFFKGKIVASFLYAGILYTEAIFTTEMSDGSYRARSREISTRRQSFQIGISYRFNHKATKAVSTVGTLQQAEQEYN